MSKFDSVFFDLDGTISDSYPGIENGIKIALKKSGIEKVPHDLIKKMIGIPLHISLGRFVFNNGSVHNAEKISKAIGYFREYYSTSGLFESTIYPDIPNILEELSTLSNVYIITAKPTAYAKKILSYHNLDRFFVEICGLTDEENFSKSNLINRISPKNNSIMIGDKSQDIIAGKEAGIMTAGVLYGYGSKQEITESNPDFIIEKTSDLIGILK